jgi:hypothetical protein
MSSSQLKRMWDLCLLCQYPPQLTLKNRKAIKSKLGTTELLATASSIPAKSIFSSVLSPVMVRPARCFLNTTSWLDQV